jgi:uncharacterized protein (TIGR03435 family)
MGGVLRTAHLALMLFPGFSANAFEQVFDAVSIKPSPPMDSSRGPIYFGPKGGPGTEDPGRYWCNYCSLSELVSQAYDVPEYRIFSADRLPEDRFHIVATIPANATRDQFRVMLQKLLADRFKLAEHSERREMQMFRLLASSGPKVKVHVEGELPASEDRNARRNRAPGFYYKVQAKTMADFAKVIEGQLRRPVADATGLNGKYDFDVWWTANYLDADPGAATDSPTIYSAIQSLGLRLESHKGQIDVVVVDHVQRLPTEN